MTQEMEYTPMPDPELENYWKISQANPMLEAKRSGQSLQTFFDSIKPSELARAFSLRDRTVRCMDERTPGGIRRPLLGDMPKIARELAGLSPDGVTSHKGCGAAGIGAHEKGLASDSQTVDAFAQACAKALANALGVAYKGQLTVEPAGFHIANVAYLADMDFDPEQVEQFAKGFVVFRHAYQNALDAKYAIGLAPHIAMSHGYNDKFSEQNPFYLIAVSKTSVSRQALEQELEELQAGLPEDMRTRTRIDGFVPKLAV